MLSKRIALSLMSVFVLSIPALVIIVSAKFSPDGSGFAFPLAAYFFYVVCSAVLIALIAGRLFRLHGFERYSFDLTFWFLFSALLALPLGTANTLVNEFADLQNDSDRLATKIGFSIGFYILLIPVLCLTEALASLAVFFHKRRRV